VLPVGDLGFQTAVMRAYRMKQMPTAEQLKKIGERWRPYRSVAVWYLWQMIHLKLPEVEGVARAKRAKPVNPKRAAVGRAVAAK